MTTCTVAPDSSLLKKFLKERKIQDLEPASRKVRVHLGLNVYQLEKEQYLV